MQTGGQRANQWQFTCGNPANGVRPTTPGMGVATTPAQNAYGAYVQLLAAATITDDIWLFEIGVSNIANSGSARDGMITIGIDNAGGTSYTDTIVDLVCGPAGAVGSSAFGTGVSFRFPLRIPAGSSVGVKGSVNSATLTAFSVAIAAWGKPTAPETVRVASWVDTYGASLATSAGTAITEGTASEGADVLIGTLARPCWALEYGIGCSNGTMVNALMKTDILLGSSSAAAQGNFSMFNALSAKSTIESITKPPGLVSVDGQSGLNFYGRIQSTNNNTGHSLAVYAIGG